MTLPPVIGLTGYARSGKDAVAAILHDLAGYQRFALADPVREMALAIDPYVPVISEDHYHLFRLSELVDKHGWTEAKNIGEVRRLLQHIGTEGVRDIIGQETWIELWRRRASHVVLGPEGTGRIVCTDVRFPNEADVVRELGGEVWRIERPGVQAVNGHVSDAGVNAIRADVVVKNVGTLHDLRTGVEALLGRARAGQPRNEERLL